MVTVGSHGCVINNLDAAPHARVPPEPDEPWRVRPRRRHRRHSPRRRWAAPAISAALAALGTAAILQLSDTASPQPPPSTYTASTENQDPQPGPSPATQTLTSDQPGKTQHQPQHDAQHPPSAHKTPPPDRARSSRQRPNAAPSSMAKQQHATPQHPRPRTHRPRAHRPRSPHPAPAWVRIECRRRFPHDTTSQAACITAVRNYLNR